MTEAARQETASAWCLKVAEGDLTPDEETQLDAWLKAAPENRDAFRLRAKIVLAATHIADRPEIIAVRADALEAMRTANQRRWAKRGVIRGIRPSLVAAAACLFLLVTGLVSHLMSLPDEFQTGVGERRVVVLQDGSRLSLDAASDVEVAYNNDARVLRLLSGRAKFDVAHDPARPFSVTAGDRTIVATGTAFSVELVKGQVRVVLYQGHVRVLAGRKADGPALSLANTTSSGKAADVELTPGRILVASLDRPIATVEPTDTQRSLAWEGGQLVFSDDPLAIAVERFNRYANKPIVVEGTAANLPISGAFNAGDVEGFVDGVSALYSLRSTRRGDRIILFSDP